VLATAFLSIFTGAVCGVLRTVVEESIVPPAPAPGEAFEEAPPTVTGISIIVEEPRRQLTRIDADPERPKAVIIVVIAIITRDPRAVVPLRESAWIRQRQRVVVLVSIAVERLRVRGIGNERIGRDDVPEIASCTRPFM
jgi:hypothetical protein